MGVGGGGGGASVRNGAPSFFHSSYLLVAEVYRTGSRFTKKWIAIYGKRGLLLDGLFGADTATITTSCELLQRPVSQAVS